MSIKTFILRIAEGLRPTSYDVRRGIVMFIGSVVIFSIVFSDAFIAATKVHPSFGVIMVVVWAAIGPTMAGVSVFATVLLTVSLCLAAINYIITVSIGYAATDGKYDPGIVKGVTLSAVSTTIVGLIHLMRVRSDALSLAGMTAQLLPGVIIFQAFQLDYPPLKGTVAIELFILIVAPGILGGIITTFLIPVHASEITRELLPKFLALTTMVKKKIFDLLKKLETDNDGTPPMNDTGDTISNDDDKSIVTHKTTSNQNLNGSGFKEGRYIGVDESIENDFVDIYHLDMVAFQLLAAIESTTNLSAVEVLIYKRPHLFPKKAFSQLTKHLKRMETLNTVMLDLLKEGKKHVTYSRSLLVSLDNLCDATATCAQILGKIVHNDTSFKDCLPALAALDTAGKSLQNEIFGSPPQLEEPYPSYDGTNKQPVTMLDESVRLRSLGVVSLIGAFQLRSAFSYVPGVVKSTQPEALNEPLLRSPAGTVIPEKLGENINNKSHDQDPSIDDTEKTTSTKHTEKDAAISKDTAPLMAGTESDPPPICSDVYKVVKVTPTSVSPLRVKLFRCGQVLGICEWHWKLVLHMMIMYLISIVFTMLPNIEKSLDNKGIWMIITIVVISDTTTGSTIDNGLLRICGTAIGMIGISMAVGFGYLANGQSYEGFSTGKKIVMAGIISVWLGVFEMLASKAGVRYTKLFGICKFIVPLISIVDAKSSEDEWKLIGFRVAITLLGICMDTFLGVFLFPVTTTDHVTQKSCVILRKVASVTGTSFHRFTLTQEELDTDAVKKEWSDVQLCILSLNQDLDYILKARNIVMKEKASSWIVRKFVGFCDRIWPWGAPLSSRGFGWRFTYCNFEKMEQLFFYIRQCFTATLVTNLIQTHSMAQGVWKPNKAWVMSIRAVGEQISECLGALRLVLLNVASMDEALKTLDALSDMLVDMNLKAEKILAEVSSSNRPMSPSERSAFSALVAAISTYRNISYLYRAAAHALKYQDLGESARKADGHLQGDGFGRMLNMEERTMTLIADEAVVSRYNDGGIIEEGDGVEFSRGYISLIADEVDAMRPKS